MKKKIINFILILSTLFYGGKKYKTHQKKVMANLGCGLRCLPGWENVDGSLTALFGSRTFSFINFILYRFAGSSEFYSFAEYDEIIKKNKLLFYDLRNGVPFKNNSLDVVFTSHFLEHLTKNDGRKFLKDCYRTLKDGGMMRIAVPDLDIAFRIYQEGRVEEMEDLFFYNSEEPDFHSHKYNYNFETLKNILSEYGFRDIHKETYQKGECPGISFLDVYPTLLSNLIAPKKE